MTDSEVTWEDWIDKNDLSSLIQLNDAQAQKTWKPTDEDRNAAWVIHNELNSRITTQSLHYRSGDEETALTSIFSLFQTTRDIIKDQGPECYHFATLALYTLNTHIRPFTAKWHRKKVDNKFTNDDDRRLFREELGGIQDQLCKYSKLMGLIALGDNFVAPKEDDPKEDDPKEDAPIPFKEILFASSTVSNESDIRSEEIEEILKRRHYPKSPSDEESESEIPNNLIGLACSGGGIRSATVCLGVSQVLAKHGILKQVDYLSTVSGGGYFGSFISSYLNSEPDDEVSKTKKTIGLGNKDLPFYEEGTAEPTPLRHLRNNSKYLLKGGLKGMSRIAALFLSGISVNIAALLPAFLALLIIAHLGKETGFFDMFSATHSFKYFLASLFLVGLIVPFCTKTKEYSEKKRISNTPIKAGIFLALLIIAALILHTAFPEFTNTVLILGLAASTAITTCVLFLININNSTLHKYYRNRLTETYLLTRTKDGKTTSVDDKKINDLTRGKYGAPYHLINCAINLPGSTEPELRGRNSDFFIFSPKWSGSQLTGYCKTEDMGKYDPNLNLGTAMSISGAAASPYMGTLSQKSWSVILSLLNVRLGYWLINPKKVNGERSTEKVTTKLTPPTPFILYKELMGGFDENQRFVNLSDGGHIENLGIYELLRRRCKFIIAIDSEADPDLNFKSLNTLIRYAKIDFDIDVSIDLSDFQKNEKGNCKAHFSLGKIDYGNDKIGYLLYIKSSLTGNERDYIQDYHRSHTSFPHESTADQFFTEEQYEAYRALGSHMAGDLFRKELGTINDSNEIEIGDFFNSLKKHLLV